jgi:hypothetical protein
MTTRQQMIANIEKMVEANKLFHAMDNENQQELLENFYSEDCHGNISWDDYVFSNCFLNELTEGNN